MNEIEVDRRKTLLAIQQAGIDPFANCDKSLYSLADIKMTIGPGNHKDGTVFSGAGKIILQRQMGKLIFLTIADHETTIQVGLERNRFSDEEWRLNQLLDLGDWIVVTGRTGRTNTGEPTIWAAEVRWAAKSLMSPPDKVAGVVDPEIKQRQRYLDLLDPEVRTRMRNRSKIIQHIRSFMNERGFLEVETPVLQAKAGGAAAQPFVTHHNSLDNDFYLRIAPELYLKKLLIGNLGPVFEIGKNFRNEGLSPKHNPEFTVLEAYQPFGTYVSMINLTSRLIEELCLLVRGKEAPIKFVRKSFVQLLNEHNITTDDLDVAFERYEKEIEPKLIEPTFVTHFPAKRVPLAKKNTVFAEMFELIINGQEIGTGYTEQNNPDEQLAVFEKQREVDTEFIEAMKYGMPPAGGVGIGIDRLVLWLLGGNNIRDVILFPTLRPQS